MVGLIGGFHQDTGWFHFTESFRSDEKCVKFRTACKNRYFAVGNIFSGTKDSNTYYTKDVVRRHDLVWILKLLPPCTKPFNFWCGTLVGTDLRILWHYFFARLSLDHCRRVKLSSQYCTTFLKCLRSFELLHYFVCRGASLVWHCCSLFFNL